MTMAPPEKRLLKGFNEVVTVDPALTSDDNPLGLIKNGAIALEGTTIAWVGPGHAIPAAWQGVPSEDFSGQVVFPGFIDSHTHPVFGGDRADEFEQRLQGKTYLDIAAAGGGIAKTVRETRVASLETLVEQTTTHLATSMAFGVTTVEAKSGYGLDVDSELKSLAAINEAAQRLPLTVIPTFMGGHDIPPEFKGNPNGYVDHLIGDMLPAIADQGIARHNDVFCEAGYFDVAQSRRILEAGMGYGLKPRIHTNEFEDIGGIPMACEVGCLSADHLLNTSPEGIRQLAASHTVATVLPGTAFYLKVPRYAPARALIDAGATVALATDFNPGSCMSQNLQLMMVLGCLHMAMLPHEAIQAVTLNAAKALGLEDDRGSVTAGKRADLALFNLTSHHQLLYHYGVNHLSRLYVAGQVVRGFCTEPATA
ncbi:MAG: imidazolonepropionase [Cyanobacteria bacterium HKST-UBA04]|nr:imidazolonepropionase [Cyanobacteria bacterium HKST-UBA04]